MVTLAVEHNYRYDAAGMHFTTVTSVVNDIYDTSYEVSTTRSLLLHLLTDQASQIALDTTLKACHHLCIIPFWILGLFVYS